MNRFFTSITISFTLIAPAFSAVSLIKPAEAPEALTVEKVEKGDPSQATVTDFNEGRYLNAVLRAQHLAESGNPYAFLVLGLAHESGKGIEQSQELALANYRKASAAGNEEATHRLARLLVLMGGAERQKEAQTALEALSEKDTGNAARILGEGILKGWFGGKGDFEQAKAWWEKASKQGDIAAMINLARLLDGQLGFPEKRDAGGALQQYLKAANSGFAPAMIQAGARLLNGEKQNRDEEAGREWLTKAVESKALDAYLVLGDYAENVTKSDEKAFAQYLKGAEAGHGPCMLKVASFYLNGRTGQDKDLKTGLAWLKKAGAAGEIAGHVQAATLLMKGEGLNIVEGYNHLLVAAEAGYTDLQNELGLLYLSGRLGVRDATAAAGWFQRAAKGKFPAGMFNFATLLEQGIGVAHSINQAGQLYTLAANAGHAKATTALGRFHAEGRGTKQDLTRAWALFSLAHERGDTDAEAFKKQVEALLNEEQLQAAGKTFDEYKKAFAPQKETTQE